MIYYFEGGHIKGQNSKIMIKFFDKLDHLIETFEFENQSMRKRELLKNPNVFFKIPCIHYIRFLKYLYKPQKTLPIIWNRHKNVWNEMHKSLDDT